MLFLVAHQFFLGVFHLHLQVHELLLKPVGGLHGGVEARLEIVLRVVLHQVIHHVGGQILVGTAVVHLDDVSVGGECDFQIAPETGEQSRSPAGVGLQRIGGEIERRGQRRGFSAELGPAVEAQILHYLQGKKIALQNLHFGFQFGGIVIVNVEGWRIAEVDQAGIRLVDLDAAARLIHRRHLEAGDGDHGKDGEQAGENRPLALHQNANIFAERRFLRRQFGVNARAARSPKVRTRGLHFANDWIIGLHQRSGIHAFSSTSFQTLFWPGVASGRTRYFEKACESMAGSSTGTF